MNNEDLQQLKALAMAATPGPWYGNFDGVYLDPLAERGKRLYPRICGVMGTRGKNELEHANADYIAAANPAAILALIARIESLAADAERYNFLCENANRMHIDLTDSQEYINRKIDAAIAKEKAK